MEKDCNYKEDIIIIGGTFNPIHYGHLSIAEFVRKELNIEKVIFIPNGNPPHKNEENIVDKNLRYEMVKLAIESNKSFFISEIEINKKGKSYTVDTLKEIRKNSLTNIKVYFIIGADVVKDIYKWKSLKEILSICTLVVVSRYNYENSQIEKEIEILNKKFNTNILFLNMYYLDISSSEIRNRVKSNRSIKYLLPPKVEEFILSKKLYQEEKLEVDYKFLYDVLRRNISSFRYAHSLNVSKVATELAKTHNANIEKAMLAGLLHDIAKEFTKEKKYKFCKKYNLYLDPIMRSDIDLFHGILGSCIVEDIFNIHDIDILNAIKYHTIARKNMSKLEKIIYIADIIEPSRGDTEDIVKLRNLAYTNLEKAFKLSLQKSVDIVSIKGKTLHPSTLEAIESINLNFT